MSGHRAETLTVVAGHGDHERSSGKVKDGMVNERSSGVTEQPAEATSTGKKTGKVVSAATGRRVKGAKGKPQEADKGKQRVAPPDPVGVAGTDKQGERIGSSWMEC